MPERNATAQARKPYKTDVTEEQWELLKGLIPPAVAKRGHKPTDLREIVNTILYQNRAGCPWDMLPNDLAARSTTNDYYQKWIKSGVWDAILEALRCQVRAITPLPPPPPPPPAPQPEPQAQPQQEAEQPAVKPPSDPAPVATAYREPTPSFAIFDSQSVKTTEVGGEQRGYDGGKKVKGRKRHIAVDSMGLLLAVVVTAANVSDGRGACELLERMPEDKFPRLKGTCGDGRYNEKKLIASLNKRNLTHEVKTRPPGAKGFVLLKKRWVVERTFAWLGFNRRLSKDYERTVASSEARVKVAAISMMLNRLTKKAA